MNIPANVLSASLLPPNASQFEQAMEASLRADIDLAAIGNLWNPATCPAAVLPFLAWGLAIARWDENWTDAEKRTQIADAIRFHKRKGTRGIIEEVLSRFHPLLQIVEWFEANPHRQPGTFEVRAPVDLIPGSFLTADVVNAIIRDVSSVMPVRCHFDFVQAMEVQASVWLSHAASAASFARFDANAAHDADPVWNNYLLTEDGEPLQTETGEFLEVT